MYATARLDSKSEAFKALDAKVNLLWDEYQGNFESYPAPKDITKEFKELLLPYAPNQNNKARDLYKRLINQKFQENG